MSLEGMFMNFKWRNKKKRKRKLVGFKLNRKYSNDRYDLVELYKKKNDKTIIIKRCVDKLNNETYYQETEIYRNTIMKDIRVKKSDTQISREKKLNGIYSLEYKDIANIPKDMLLDENIVLSAEKYIHFDKHIISTKSQNNIPVTKKLKRLK